MAPYAIAWHPNLYACILSHALLSSIYNEGTTYFGPFEDLCLVGWIMPASKLAEAVCQHSGVLSLSATYSPRVVKTNHICGAREDLYCRFKILGILRALCFTPNLTPIFNFRKRPNIFTCVCDLIAILAAIFSRKTVLPFTFHTPVAKAYLKRILQQRKIKSCRIEF